MGPQVDEQLIEALYGTAVETGDWRPALERFSMLLDSCEATLAVGAGGPELHAVHTIGRVLTPEIIGRYVDHFGRFDPKLKILARNIPGYVFNDARHFDEQFLAHNYFYQEYSRHVGTRHTLDMLAERSAGREVYLAVMRTRHPGPYELRAEELLRQSCVHFIRALTLKEKTDRLRQAGEALDSLTFGVVVIDAFHRVAFVNRPAEELLMQNGELRLCRGMLSLRSAAVDRKLQSLIDAALAGHREGGAMRIPDGDGSSSVLRVAPLPATRAIGVHSSPAVLLLISEQGKHRLSPGDLVALYGLTEAESRVALAIAQGGTLARIAQHHGVKYSTVRSQCLSIMHKMGVHRQAEVARTLAHLPRPN